MDSSPDHTNDTNHILSQNLRQDQASPASSSSAGTTPNTTPTPSTPTHGTGMNLTLGLSGAIVPTMNHNTSLLNKLHKVTTYSSPPPVACSPENNICKLIEYRGAKIAAFVVDKRELVCLPQAFELFLKHLVGGLHTVYTKLKRLEITPVVCNVEQVRILRGLGAIQPGVNRCKLISCKEFDILYEDCTNSSARPGRPPKRSPSIHASPETLEKLKKSRLDGLDYPYDPRIYGDRKSMLNGFPHHPYAMGPLPFMPLNHPMISPPVTMATMVSHLGLRPDGSMMKDRSNSDSDLLSPRSRDDRDIKVHVRSPQHCDPEKVNKGDYDNNKPLNLHINGHAKDYSKYSSNCRSEDIDEEDDKLSDDDRDDDLDGSMEMGECANTTNVVEKMGGTTYTNHFASQLINGDSANMSSIETLLLNIQGLLKVAAENAKHHERQLNYEKAELKVELMREREMRENLEKQLFDEQRNRAMLQKRLKKEKKARRKLQEQAEDYEQRKVGVGIENTTSSPESNRNQNEPAPVERTNHLFENYLTHNGSSNPSMFPYMSLVKDVQ